MSPRKKVLIVDDNQPFRFLLTAFLQNAGLETIEAADGYQALQMLLTEEPGVILLDLQMEPLGGFGFMEEFNERKYAIPVVLITGDTSTDVLTRATNFGIASVLQKPVTQTRVIEIVQRLL